MPDWPIPGTWDGTEGGVYSTSTALLGLNATAAAATGVFGTNNLGIFVPMRLARTVTVYKMAAGGGTTGTGNFDLGIYDRFGNRIVSFGAQAKTTTAQEYILNITDTQVGPGLFYMGMSVSSGTDTFVMLTPTGTSPVPLQKARLYGTLQAASAYTLPATVTYAARTTTTGVIPAIACYLRSY